MPYEAEKTSTYLDKIRYIVFAEKVVFAEMDKQNILPRLLAVGVVGE